MSSYQEYFDVIKSNITGRYRVEENDLRMAEQLFNFILPDDYKYFFLKFGCGILCNQIYFSGIFDNKFGREARERIGHGAEYQLVSKVRLYQACEDKCQVENYGRPLPVIENTYMFADHVSGALFFFEKNNIKSDYDHLLLLEDDGPLHYMGNSFTEFIIKFCNNEYADIFNEVVKDVVFTEHQEP